MGVIPLVGVCPQFDQWLAATVGTISDLQLILWVNDYVPGPATVYADLEQPTDPAYGGRPIDPAAWQPAVIEGDGAQAYYGSSPQIYPAVSAAVTVYGYALVDPAGDVVRYVERLNPVMALAVGDGLSLWPRLRLGSWCECPAE